MRLRRLLKRTFYIVFHFLVVALDSVKMVRIFSFTTKEIFITQIHTQSEIVVHSKNSTKLKWIWHFLKGLGLDGPHPINLLVFFFKLVFGKWKPHLISSYFCVIEEVNKWIVSPIRFRNLTFFSSSSSASQKNAVSA